MLWAGMAPTAAGASLTDETDTVALWVASRPPGSRAVTVIVAVPRATPVMVTVPPDTEALATPVFADAAR